MRYLLLLAFCATTLTAQTPSALARRLDRRQADARRAVAQAVAAERQLQVLPARPGTVAVIAGTSAAGKLRGLGTGLADLLATDLARVHVLRLVERMQAQAIVTELTRSGVDEWLRPRAWRMLGASDIVVVEAQMVGASLRLSARVVNLGRERVDATAGERRTILDRPAAKIDAFLAWSAALDAIESGDVRQAERLLQRALDNDPGVNAAFDAGILASAGLATALGGVVPMSGTAVSTGDDPTGDGLATEGNESEYGEAWFEGAGDRRLTLWELAVPLSASLPLGRGRFDVSTIWSSNRADTPANDVFHAWGFTDVHARYTHPLGHSGASVTVGGAFPVRNAHGVDDDIRRVPLPPDLLPSAMYRRRSAPSASAGVFFTRSLGAWAWGAAGGGEWNASYDELNPTLHTVAVAPGMRYRVRADVKRWTAGGANAADVVVPQVGFTRPLTRILLTEIGADYVTGHFHEAPSTTDIPVRGWMLRTRLRIEP
ncbi:MAG: hypothetical protein ACYC3F_00655 [Gemmatimonadaceae bacterium]